MTSWPKVPPEVVDNVRQRWPDRADEWVRSAEQELPELCLRYSAKPRRVLPARYGFVVAADTPTEGIIFRSSHDPHGLAQAQVARVLADLGAAPVVHETIPTSTGTWMVLDEVRPGTPLAQADPSSVTLDALAAPLAVMSGHPPPSPGIPSVADWLRDRLEDDNLADLTPGFTVAPRHERRTAIDTLDQLAANAAPALCHGDASTWNVLATKDNGWLLIDPRGMTGEPSYDVAVLSLKINQKQGIDMTARLATEVGVDPERTQAWLTVAKAARV